MRLPPLPPAAMMPEQRALHDDMAPVVAEHLKGPCCMDPLQVFSIT